MNGYRWSCKNCGAFGHFDASFKKNVKVQQGWVVKKQTKPTLVEQDVAKDQAYRSTSYIDANANSTKDAKEATMLQTKKDNNVDKILDK